MDEESCRQPFAANDCEHATPGGALSSAVQNSGSVCEPDADDRRDILEHHAQSESTSPSSNDAALGSLFRDIVSSKLAVTEGDMLLMVLRLLSRKTTGQGAITWRFYKDISKFLGCLPVNDSSLVDETIGGDGATVEMIIDSMQNGTTALSGDEFETDATAGRTPPAPAHDVLFESAALPSSSSSQTADTEDSSRAQLVAASRRAAKPSRHATQKSLLAELVNTNRQLCSDIKESRKEEMELRRMELDILRESAATEKRLTEALLKYLEK
ncbi:hypothetical protein V5799_014178 [Amblyomma americanum]|uniref:Uncharacterized protein n=1 Tax=Amblyomma americanum TaxID=6943 RepID=A0AAQ4E3S8_AMBAM